MIANEERGIRLCVQGHKCAVVAPPPCWQVVSSHLGRGDQEENSGQIASLLLVSIAKMKNTMMYKSIVKW
eukprot:scaffold659_cov192-Ochromonas_danica.AAC.1